MYQHSLTFKVQQNFTHGFSKWILEIGRSKDEHIRITSMADNTYQVLTRISSSSSQDTNYWSNNHGYADQVWGKYGILVAYNYRGVSFYAMIYQYCVLEPNFNIIGVVRTYALDSTLGIPHIPYAEIERYIS